MPNYKQEVVAGSKWRRCRQIIVDNNFGVTPRLVFQEQDVVDFGGGQYVFKEVHPSSAVVAYPLTTSFDANTNIEIYNPLTGEKTGQTMTHGEVYAILYSAYMNAAINRDTVEQQPIE